jgi:hypothetical protein
MSIQTMIRRLHAYKKWILRKQVDPKRWGRYGWKTLLGMTWIICIKCPHRKDLLEILWNIIQMTPAFLMCRYCANHFYCFHEKHPLLLDNVWKQPLLLFEWLVQAQQNVSMHMIETGEILPVQYTLQEMNKFTKDWYLYFQKQFSSIGFYKLWLFEVLLFCTTLLRCLSPPLQWSRDESLIIQTYFHFVTLILQVCHPYSIPQLKIPTERSEKEWNKFWWMFLNGFFASKHAYEPLMIWNTSLHFMQTYLPKKA